MHKLRRSYRQYVRAFIASDVLAMNDARTMFSNRLSIVLAQDRTITRKKSRELDPDKQKEIQQEEEQVKRSGNIKKLGLGMRRVMIDYVENISQFREEMKDISQRMDSSDFIGTLRQQSDQNEDEVKKPLSEEKLKAVIDAYNSIGETMMGAQRQILGLVKNLTVLWTPVRHLPDFLARWVQEGDKTSQEKARQRQLYRSTYEDGRLLKYLQESGNEADARKIVREKLRKSRSMRKFLELLRKKHRKSTAKALESGILVNDPERAARKILLKVDEWNYSAEQQQRLKDSLQKVVSDASKIGMEFAEDFDLEDDFERNAIRHYNTLIRMAQQTDATQQLTKLEDEVDMIVNEWAEESERFLVRVERIADALADAYGTKDQFEKQLDLLKKAFLTQDCVLAKLINSGVRKVTTLLEYSDRLLEPMLGKKGDEGLAESIKKQEESPPQEEEEAAVVVKEEKTVIEDAAQNVAQKVTDFLKKHSPEELSNLQVSKEELITKQVEQLYPNSPQKAQEQVVDRALVLLSKIELVDTSGSEDSFAMKLEDINGLMNEGIPQQFKIAGKNFIKERMKALTSSEEALNKVYTTLLEKVTDKIVEITIKKMLAYISPGAIADRIGEEAEKKFSELKEKKGLSVAKNYAEEVLIAYYRDGHSYMSDFDIPRSFIKVWQETWTAKAGRYVQRDIKPDQLKLVGEQLEEELLRQYQQLISYAIGNEGDVKKLTGKIMPQFKILHASLGIRSFCT